MRSPPSVLLLPRCKVPLAGGGPNWMPPRPDSRSHILEVLVAREAQLITDPVREAISRALALDDGVGPATVRLHPDDVATMGALDPGREVVVIPDPAVGRGGALVEIDDSVLDGQLESALDRVREVLLGDGAPGAGR